MEPWKNKHGFIQIREFLKNVRGNILYVGLSNDLDSTDSVENKGTH